MFGKTGSRAKNGLNFPYTIKNTTLGIKEKSDTLNIETDIIGKYIDRLLTFDGEDTEIDTNILKAIRHIQYGES